MLGTIVNTITIIIGSLLGILIKGGIGEKKGKAIVQAVSLCVIIIGINGAISGIDYIIEIIVFIVLGTYIGEVLDIEGRLERFGKHLENRFLKESSTFSKGFVSASLLYCVGAMAIMGSLEGGLKGNHEILFAKSVLDGTLSVILASTLGIGVAFSAFAVLIYQGSIALTAGLISGILNDIIVLQISSTGSVLIMGLGISMLFPNKLRIGNMLPAVIMPLIYNIIILLIN